MRLLSLSRRKGRELRCHPGNEKGRKWIERRGFAERRGRRETEARGLPLTPSDFFEDPLRQTLRQPSRQFFSDNLKSSQQSKSDLDLPSGRKKRPSKLIFHGLQLPTRDDLDLPFPPSDMPYSHHSRLSLQHSISSKAGSSHTLLSCRLWIVLPPCKGNSRRGRSGSDQPGLQGLLSVRARSQVRTYFSRLALTYPY